ncbi:hypothetical protein [Brunnivagina elsteri]|uniref:Uncharacterized protein n=1 Tax=Brunnivagina elsteri CCALA 953 TaxID=987040 RepID=A0A2A2TFX3_9CYAN|nr:hypothetical protein [Calothrix elsteri]PAX52576.1 hypothetical protein CK510_18580 [Calothrix elsteri CCALA 953]
MDLLIVGSSDDSFCVEVSELVKQKGYTTGILDVCDAARLFSISIADRKSQVTPDIPVILRIPSPATIRTSFDDSFMYGECLATLWAATTLSKSIVINRPTANSLWGNVSYSSTLTKLRAGYSNSSVEIFSSQIPSSPQALLNKQWCLQDLATYDTSFYPQIPNDIGPFRASWVDSNLDYEIVVVLDDKAWRCTNVGLEHLRLEEKSISLLRNLDLVFGTITWSIESNLEKASVARINPYPSLEEIQFVWSAFAPALLETIFS